MADKYLKNFKFGVKLINTSQKLYQKVFIFVAKLKNFNIIFEEPFKIRLKSYKKYHTVIRWKFCLVYLDFGKFLKK